MKQLGSFTRCSPYEESQLSGIPVLPGVNKFQAGDAKLHSPVCGAQIILRCAIHCLLYAIGRRYAAPQPSLWRTDLPCPPESGAARARRARTSKIRTKCGPFRPRPTMVKFRAGDLNPKTWCFMQSVCWMQPDAVQGYRGDALPHTCRCGPPGPFSGLHDRVLVDKRLRMKRLTLFGKPFLLKSTPAGTRGVARPAQRVIPSSSFPRPHTTGEISPCNAVSWPEFCTVLPAASSCFFGIVWRR